MAVDLALSVGPRLVREAKLEHYVAGTEKEYRLEKNLVRWVQDITHNMGGLRNAASLQFSLIRETIDRGSVSPEDQQGSQEHPEHLWEENSRPRS